MAIDPSIPLQSVPQIDPSKGIAQLIQAKQFREQMDFKKEEAGKAQEARDLQNQALNQKLAEGQNTAKLNRLAEDAVLVRPMIASGNIEGAKELLTNRSARLRQMAAQGKQVDSLDTDRFIQILDADPNQALSEIDQVINGLSRLGFVKTDSQGGLFSAKTNIWKNGTVMRVGPGGEVEVESPSGEVVFGQDREKVLQQAYQDENSNLKSEKEVKQILEIAEAKANFGRNFREEALRLTKLAQDIQAGEFKLQESAENKEKGQETKQTLLRLTNELLANADGVRAYVGPLDQITPDLLPKTLKARTAFNQAKSLLTVDNLKLMTGVLSETDIQILAAVAGGGLDPSGDDEQVLNEIERINQSLKNEITSGSSSGGLTPEEQAELEELERLEAEGKL